MRNRARDLLEKLYYASVEIDLAFCDLLNTGESELSGEEYDSLMDVFVEVEDFLGIK